MNWRGVVKWKTKLKDWKIIRLSILQKIRKHILKRTLLAYQSITSLWYHISRNTTSLNWRGESRQEKNERRLLNSLVNYLQENWSYLAVNTHYSLREGEMSFSKGNLEMNGASALVYTGSMASTEPMGWDCSLELWRMEWDLPKLFYRGRTTVHWSLLWRAEHCTKKDDYSWALRSDGIHSTMFWMCLRHITFHLSYSSFWNGNSYPMPTVHCISIAPSLSGFTG